MPASGKSAIQLYRSVTAGVRPSSLLAGELFLNEVDGALCWPDSGGNVRTTWLDSNQGAPKTVTTTTYTINSADRYLIMNPPAVCTVTLPTPATALTGRLLTFKNLSTFMVSSATANVKTMSSATPTSSILAATAGKFVELVCDGSYWVAMLGN